ncbi:ABC transporter permease [Nocardiopsis kunsanensis]|uniref:Transport permease protein n=1 Tax=Nocardiopsis kunsanensis TaxID=141693 RepID=A0A918XBU1_9ACTN|nr:ABC transporter permease [Nocardiopsis kunsanensis]GHD25334.1 transport permease protein [Nocardiopsis kunsanensis]
MKPATNAVRLGLARGWIDFLRLSTTPGELFGYVFYPAVFLGIAASTTIEHDGTGTDGSAYLMTGGVAFLLANTLLLVAQTIGTEREDGTLLRAKALPHGMLGYTVGKSLQLMFTSAVSLVLTLVGALVLVGGFSVQGWSGALLLSGFCALGILALAPYGAILGSLTTNPRMAVAVAMIALLSLSLVSGVFFPVDILPAWAGVVGTVFPLYWIGVGLRAALLPEAQVALEATGSWELPQAAGVLMVWIVVGFLVAPWVLRRMARRESGSRVSEARERAMQRAY